MIGGHEILNQIQPDHRGRFEVSPSEPNTTSFYIDIRPLTLPLSLKRLCCNRMVTRKAGSNSRIPKF